MVEHDLQVDRPARLARGAGRVARVRVGEREDAAEVAPAALVAHEQRQVAAARQVDLGAVDRPHPELAGGLGELHRAGDRVVVGQRERR